MKFLIKITLGVFLLGVAMFAKEVATITALSGSAFVERDGTKIEIKLGSKLEELDTVITHDNAKVQIIFKDETVVSLGKNSNFSISEYMFEENKEPVVKFAMLSGAMRTITGKIGKVAPEKFSVKAKTATIGIRGTNFSILVGESVEVYCTFGAISVNVNGVDNIVRQGFFIAISPEGNVEIKAFTPEQLKDMKEKNFAKSQAKSGTASEDGVASNESQLDNTKEDFENIVIRDVSNSVVDSHHTEANSQQPTDASIIAGYSMNGVVYEGAYVTTSNNTINFANSGHAKLIVNFSEPNFTKLILGGHPSDTAVFQGHLNSGAQANKFDLIAEEAQGGGGIGSATGQFYGASGNIVKGDFNFMPENYSGQAIGTYEVTSSQKLK